MIFKELKDKFLFIPYSGCNYVGANFYLYHYKGFWIGVDCGIGFPDKRKTPGVDIMLPNSDLLSRYNIKLDALIITHAHEDHIGAVCDLIQDLDCPIYCTTFAKNFLEEELNEERFRKADLNLNINEIDLDKQRIIEIGPFNIEMVRVTHSTVEAVSLYIKTEKGKVLHTGDWKLDQFPVIGPLTEEGRLEEIGKEGLDALICDSTNSFSDKQDQFEGLLEENIYDIVRKTKGAAIIASFASNIARIQTAAQVAKRTSRKIVISGSSMHRMIRIAQKSGYLKNIEFVDIKEVGSIERSKCLILSTGSQGEEQASLNKIAFDKNKFFKLQAEDGVIFSSRAIPGNEIDIYNIINKLIEKNVNVVTADEKFVHVSGHPYQKDLKKMYELTKPFSLVPMHGNKIMITEQMKFAEENGIKHTIHTENGVVVNIEHKKVKVIGKIKTEIKFLDGLRQVHQDTNIIEERKKLSANGIIFVSVLINKDLSLISTAEILFYGIFDTRDEKDKIDGLKNSVNNGIKERILHKQTPFNSKDSVEQFVRNKVEEFVRKKVGKNPIISISVRVMK